MSKVIDTPVLIVGAGPVGLALALDLGWRGTDCVVVDKGAGEQVLHPRAGGVAARTMEFCRRWGIDDRVKDAGFPRDRNMDVIYCLSLAESLVARQSYPPLGKRSPLPFSPEHRERCPQIWFDPILAKAAKEYTDYVSLLYRHTLRGFEQDDEHVTAHVHDDLIDEDVTVRARYMVAGDGADSGIRSALGIRPRDNLTLSYSVNAIFRSPMLRHANRHGDAVRYLFVGPTGVWSNMTVIDGKDLWRFTVIGSEEKMDLATLDLAKELRRAIGTDDIPFEILTVAPWRRKQLNAERYSVGRIFLAGDAAHTMSPTGGAGMNTGVQDSVDLGWKLDAVVKGWGGKGLLDSYDVERRPIGMRNSTWSSGNFKVWVAPEGWSKVADQTEEGERTRREMGRQLSASLESEWESWGIQLGYRYENSPICVPDGSPPPPDQPGEYVPTACPGSRAPHAWLEDGRSILDLYGRGYVLLRLGDAPPDVSKLEQSAFKRCAPMEVVDLPQAEIRSLYGADLVLVRPDGHVAWRGAVCPDDPQDLIDTVTGNKTGHIATHKREARQPAYSV